MPTDETSGVVPRFADYAVDRAAVGMRIEHVHEHAELERIALEVRISGALDHDDTTVGGRQHCVRFGRYRTRRIAEKLEHEHSDQPENDRPGPAGEQRHSDCRHEREREKQPAFARDDGVGIVGTHE